VSSPDVRLSSVPPIVLEPPGDLLAGATVVASEPACGNCGHPLGAEARYCGSCGQRHRQGRLEVIEVIADVFNNFVAVDHGIFYTIATLTHDPGRVVRDYWSGKRRTYISPVTYLVTGAAMQVIMDRYDATARALARGAALRRAAAHPNAAHAAAHMKLQQFLWTTPGARGVITAACMAAAIWILFRWRREPRESGATAQREGINFSEALVTSCYLNGHTFLIGSVLATLLTIAAGIEWRERFNVAAAVLIPIAFLGGTFGWRTSVVARAVGAFVLMLVLYQVWFTLTRTLIVLLSGS
jgi:hypothetical protein